MTGAFVRDRVEARVLRLGEGGWGGLTSVAQRVSSERPAPRARSFSPRAGPAARCPSSRGSFACPSSHVRLGPRRLGSFSSSRPHGQPPESLLAGPSFRGDGRVDHHVPSGARLLRSADPQRAIARESFQGCGGAGSRGEGRAAVAWKGQWRGTSILQSTSDRPDMYRESFTEKPNSALQSCQQS